MLARRELEVDSFADIVAVHFVTKRVVLQSDGTTVAHGERRSICCWSNRAPDVNKLNIDIAIREGF